MSRSAPVIHYRMECPMMSKHIWARWRSASRTPQTRSDCSGDVPVLCPRCSVAMRTRCPFCSAIRNPRRATSIDGHRSGERPTRCWARWSRHLWKHCPRSAGYASLRLAPASVRPQNVFCLYYRQDDSTIPIRTSPRAFLQMRRHVSALQMLQSNTWCWTSRKTRLNKVSRPALTT